MGVYTATEEVGTAVKNNLAAKIDAVATHEDVTLDNSFTFYDRERATTFWKKSKAGAGVWVRSASTGAISQKERRWRVDMIVDYAYRGQDRSEVWKQIELTVDAIMRVVDDFISGSSTNSIIAAGEDRFGSVAMTDLDDKIQEASGDVTPHGPIGGAVRVEVPIIQKEQIT